MSFTRCTTRKPEFTSKIGHWKTLSHTLNTSLFAGLRTVSGNKANLDVAQLIYLLSDPASGKQQDAAFLSRQQALTAASSILPEHRLSRLLEQARDGVLQSLGVNAYQIIDQINTGFPVDDCDAIEAAYERSRTSEGVIDAALSPNDRAVDLFTALVLLSQSRGHLILPTQEANFTHLFNPQVLKVPIDGVRGRYQKKSITFWRWSVSVWYGETP